MKTNQTAHPLPSSVSDFPVGSREGSGLAVFSGASRLVRKCGAWQDHAGLESLLCAIRAESAAEYHRAVLYALWRQGWHAMREYAVAKYGAGGRIDVMATRGEGEWLALELDNRSPRGKSIIKLEEWLPEQNLPGLMTGILLRNPK